MTKQKTINIRGSLIDLSEPRVMGVINVTPDSFYSKSRKQSVADILDHASLMLKEGATFLDVGGYSSRPGADEVDVKEELNRVSQAIREIVRCFPEAVVSVDTFRSEVARAALDEGAGMINDISGGTLDEKIMEVVAQYGTPYVCMHMRGVPQTMQEMTTYGDILEELMLWFSTKVKEAESLGIKDVILDPGFGFAKKAAQSFYLLNHLDYFHLLNKPLLVGFSRKSMIYKTLNIEPDQALNGTTVLNTVALLKGASILRVHDVKEAMEVIKLVNCLNA